MNQRHEYIYVPYDKDDERYFGSREVVRAEWDYLYKRRASQSADSDRTEEEIVSVVVPHEDDLRGFWITIVRIFTRVQRNKPARTVDPSATASTQSETEPPNQTGIALSGGGIRSASFCLGVMQALSYAGWFHKLDYMSTVSGGGYIGGSLSWLLHRKWKGPDGKEIPYGLDRTRFPYGSYPMVGMEAREDEKGSGWNVYKGRMLRHLRQHARYLTPGNGLNYMSLLAVALRNTLFSLFVYGGLLMVIFALIGPYLFQPADNWSVYAALRKIIVWLPHAVNIAHAMGVILVAAFLAAASGYVFLVLLPKIVSTGYRLRYFFERWLGRLLTLLLVVVVIGFVPVVYCWINQHEPQASSLQITGKAGDRDEIKFSGSFKPSETAELLGKTLSITGKAGQTGQISFTGGIEPAEQHDASPKSPGSIGALKDKLAAWVGGLSTLLASIASIWAFFQEGKPKKKIPNSVLVALASFGLIFGSLLLAYYFAMLLRVHLGIAIESTPWVTRPAPFSYAMNEAGMLAVLGGIFLFFLRFPNLNYLSLHRYYRDRLMETFTPDLPDAIHLNGPVPGAPKSADHTHLFEMLNENGGAGALGPYHIINTNIVLVSSEIPKFRARGGDNFILTPLYCGSNATGWCETRHEDSPYHAMTLPTAIAISGAALHSNAGPDGNGLTRSPWLSFLMGFFNIRLGYWAPNPTPNTMRLERIAKELERSPKLMPEQNEQAALTAKLRTLGHRLFALMRWPYKCVFMLAHYLLSLPLFAFRNNPNALFPGLLEVNLRRNLDENSRMVQLSDGGHFENLGLYELIRRRLKLIIVCDGTADIRYGFEDMANAMEKVRADFGALIEFDCQDMESLTPKGVIETGAVPEKRVTYANQGYLVGRIIYNNRSEGTLIYLTTTFFKELSADLYGYRKAHEEFPDQPTSDQFFDEKQFEAYRELGYQTAHKMMCDEKVVTNSMVRHTLGLPQIHRPEKWNQPQSTE